MVYKASCVLEGGAMMGVYTAGVLDVLIEKNIYFTHAIGVSAGSANAIDYAAGQLGRTINCMAVKNKHLRFFGIESIKRSHRFYDFEMCFQKFADIHFPFDYEAFAKSPVSCEVVATDITSGKPVYLKCAREGKQMVRAARASSSLPFLSDFYDCDGYLCLDGGITDSIPFERAQTYGNDKMVIVLTKPYGTRKEPPKRLTRILTFLKYHRYPKLIEAMNTRFRMYNRQAAAVEMLEKQGKVFVFRPDKLYVGRMEQDYDKLMKGYQAGVDDAKRRLDELLAYLNS